ncbi:hypothetical protein CT0861_11293 [Colletotrichum tofieldiae]|uniref:Uncharacterized protein n=1 Tax=Colletotrichum tofieldiae TaxID=708197 RepID=A0A166W2G5_9PEZI|nr:hypothetical protein CT0861_11293 [Colletotrichum tofieldiae]
MRSSSWERASQTSSDAALIIVNHPRPPAPRRPLLRPRGPVTLTSHTLRMQAGGGKHALFGILSLPYLDLAAPVTPLRHLPVAQLHLHDDAQEPGDADAAAVADARRAEAELPVLARHLLHDLRKRVDVDRAAQQPLPEDDDEHHVHRRDEVEHGVRRQQPEVAHLKQRRQVQPVDADERRRRPRDEDPQLVQEPVHRVELAELRERRRPQREQQRRRHPLVDRVLGDVHQQQRQHVRHEERPGPLEVVLQAVLSVRVLRRVRRRRDRRARREQRGRRRVPRQVRDLVLLQVLLRHRRVVLPPRAQGALGQHDEEADEHDGRQARREQQAVAHAEPPPVRHHDVEPGADQPRRPRAAAPAREAHGPVVVRQPEEAELAAAGADAGDDDADHLHDDGLAGGREGDEEHAGAREGDEDQHAEGVRHAVDVVGRDELREEGGEDVGEEDDAFRDRGPDEVLGGGEDDHVEDVVDEACCVTLAQHGLDPPPTRRMRGSVPSSQKATTTCVSACRKSAERRAEYSAHDDDGDPGMGRRPEDEGDRPVMVHFSTILDSGRQKTSRRRARADTSYLDEADGLFGGVGLGRGPSDGFGVSDIGHTITVSKWGDKPMGCRRANEWVT